MPTYKVIADREIAGKNYGETLTADDLAGANIDALLAQGAITETTTTKKKEEE